MTRTVGRDPFARGEYKRVCTSDPVTVQQGCRWCGAQPKRLYAYGWWNDGTRAPRDDKGRWFCNRGCCEAFHRP